MQEKFCSWPMNVLTFKKVLIKLKKILYGWESSCYPDFSLWSEQVVTSAHGTWKVYPIIEITGRPSRETPRAFYLSHLWLACLKQYSLLN